MFASIPYLARLLDAVAPRLCSGCGAPAGDDLCSVCVERLLAQPLPVRRRVGSSTLSAAFLFAGPARRAVHAAKYRGRERAISLLAAVAAERLGPVLAAEAPSPGAVIPVPLGRRRRRRRGYNQAEGAARALAGVPWGGPLDTRLVRTRETGPQVGRAHAARSGNVAGAFAWKGPPLDPTRSLWLVDDVATTGATLAAAAVALQQAGARRIEFVAVCGAP
jgi:predicted amidophosphoribosyltransferase